MASLQQLVCQYHAWHPSFRSVAFRSRMVELPWDFVDFLLQDGVHFEDENSALPNRFNNDDLSSSGEWSDDESADGDAEGQEPWQQRFSDVASSVERAIQELGGAAVPRLNWSCPTDATWISPNKSLMCQNADEVLLLLKSSDRVAHDLQLLRQLRDRESPEAAETGVSLAEAVAEGQASVEGPAGTQNAAAGEAAAVQQERIGGVRAVLVLRKWHELRPEREFRCFVRQRRLVAACQRDISQHYPQLQDQADTFRQLLGAFHEQKITPWLFMEDCVYDVYVATTGAVRLLDFSPVGPAALPLLFEWRELPFSHHFAPHATASALAVQQLGDAEGSGGEGMEAAVLWTAAELEDDNGSGTSSSSGSGEVLDGEMELRLVPQDGSFQAGHQLACGMPYDMLMLQDQPTDMQDMIALMEKQWPHQWH